MLSNQESASSRLRDRMARAEEYMRRVQLPPHLRRRMRQYYQFLGRREQGALRDDEVGCCRSCYCHTAPHPPMRRS